MLVIGRGKRSGFTQRLRRRFIVGAMAAVTLVLAAINVASYLSVCQQADGRLAYIASCEGLVPYASGEKPSKDRERELKSDLAKYGLSVEMMFELRYFTVVVNADGSMGEAYTDRIATVDEDEARQLVQTLAQQGRTSGFSDAYRFCVVDAPSTSGDDGGRMYILLDCGRDLSKFWGTFAMSLVVGAAGLLLVLLLVIMFSHIVLKPVVESYEKQQRFVTDASHEIKTPLAVIDAANEVLKIEHGEDEWTDSIHEQVERLSGLCEQLVMLSRMDEGGSRLNVRQVDIAKVVREAAVPFETLAGARGKRLEVRTPGHLDYRADPEAVARVGSSARQCDPLRERGVDHRARRGGRRARHRAERLQSGRRGARGRPQSSVRALLPPRFVAQLVDGRFGHRSVHRAGHRRGARRQGERVIQQGHFDVQHAPVAQGLIGDGFVPTHGRPRRPPMGWNEPVPNQPLRYLFST